MKKFIMKLELQKKINLSCWRKVGNCLVTIGKKSEITENKNSILNIIVQETTNFAKLNIFPKLHKDLCQIPGCPAILNCRTPTEKLPDYHLQPT